MKCFRRPSLAIVQIVAVVAAPALAAAGVDVPTYHQNNFRTGWNNAETVLRPANVVPGQFGLQRQVALDEQVDAQPLYVSEQSVGGASHNVVYTVTENNSVYAIDAATGAILLQTNLGAPVPISALPGGCNNNSVVVGINSTPVIDVAAQRLYVIAYTLEAGQPTYRIHALSLSTLQDTITPAPVIAATATYRNGAAAHFAASAERQRPALLESKGTLYAGFGSFCDQSANLSRGWMLGWTAATLAPLPTARLIDKNATDADSYFLSSIWMSGAGPAADASGAIYFTTANSDPNGATFNPIFNLEESVIRMSADLSRVLSRFTPADNGYGWPTLDQNDLDLGAGGVLLLPNQPGLVPHLAAIAGKTGPMYLLDADRMGGSGTAGNTLGGYTSAGCWCTQSYYQGADGIGRIVDGAGNNLTVYRVVTSALLNPLLLQESVSPVFNNDQDPGIFTSISSNGTLANTAIIWALTRPSANNADPYGIYLHAINPAAGSTVTFSAQAGTWANAANADANLVPTVANGQVFVASYKTLSIFGPITAGNTEIAFQAPPRPVPVPSRLTPHELRGTVTSLAGTVLTLHTRDGASVRADFAAAGRGGRVAEPRLGHAALLRGDYAADGTFIVQYLLHQKDNPAYWPADR
jgi:hypothetical protein